MTLAFELAWDPAIRGILVVALGAAILMGGVYLLLGTNLGARLGFLVAMAGLFGWMSIMGLTWWLYGIGYQGPSPSWRVTEIVRSQSADDTSAAALADVRDLSEWEALPEGDPSRGEAEATATEALAGTGSRVAVFDSATELAFLDTGAYELGGKSDGLLQTLHLPGPHPAHYAVVQAQAVIPVVTLTDPAEECPANSKCIVFGETPPSPEIDQDSPVLSVVMVRDLGSERLPPAVMTIASLAIFGVTCNVLHRRDKAATEARTRFQDSLESGRA